jgi:hypothetical protein
MVYYTEPTDQLSNMPMAASVGTITVNDTGSMDQQLNTPTATSIGIKTIYYIESMDQQLNLPAATGLGGSKELNTTSTNGLN